MVHFSHPPSTQKPSLSIHVSFNLLARKPTAAKVMTKGRQQKSSLNMHVPKKVAALFILFTKAYVQLPLPGLPELVGSWKLALSQGVVDSSPFLVAWWFPPFYKAPLSSNLFCNLKLLSPPLLPKTHIVQQRGLRCNCMVA